ncbi:hypothetical protein AAH145_10990 [Bacteroides thetaiotaomicron]|uniref:hypothetical protein n=2 Tax=Bacteroides TaxID=816 RepID=UPI0021648463|nr:hypothetical protein NXW51_09380 [Bacteroides fragilis]
MKKKFDFSAEMSEAESIKATPKNEYLEEEKRLLDINAKELASLNDNVHYMITNLENLFDFLRENKATIAQQTKEEAEKFGQSVLDKFLHQIQDKCNETERKIRKANSYIFIPHTTFYILIIILVALSSFFASIIIANAEILHSEVIWKAVICCSLMTVLGIGIAIAIQKILDRNK